MFGRRQQSGLSKEDRIWRLESLTSSSRYMQWPIQKETREASCSQEFGFAVCAHVHVKLPWSVGLVTGRLARAVEADTG